MESDDNPFARAVPQPISGSHHGPIDLAEVVHSSWHELIGGTYEPPPLPSKPLLKYLLECCFYSSLEQDESRPSRFALAFTTSRDLPGRQGREKEVVSAIRFDPPRPLNVQELRRLAGACDPDATFLWCSSCATSDEGAEIVGLLNAGESWAAARRGTRISHSPPPHALLVKVMGPGSVTVFQGEYLVARVESGRLHIADIERMMDHSRMSSFSKEGLAKLSESIRRPEIESPREWFDYEYLSHQNAIVGVVNTMQACKHGGTLVLCPDAAVNDLRRLLRFKYVIAASDQPLRLALERFLTCRHAWGDLCARWETDADAISQTELELHVHRTNDAGHELTRAVALVGRLSGTDGVLAIASDLSVLGFGGEILSEAHLTIPVVEAVDPIPRMTIPLDAEQFGMRHRSAFRLVAAAEQVLCYVVSQDGAVSLIWKDKGRVIVRRGIDVVSPHMPL